MSARGFQSLLQSFLVDYLPRRRGYSPNTVASYRDAFVLLLSWFAAERGIPAERLAMSDLGGAAASDFVGWMRDSRGSSPGTCNNRLAAVKSFARFVQYEAPEHISACRDILRTPQLKAPRREMQWLSLQAVTALVEAASARGVRDLALVSLLYDCGARASELCGMSVGSLFLGAPSSATVVGKGRKGRAIPLSPQVAKIAGDYTKACRAAAGPGDPLFVNRSGRAIGRAGVAYVVDACARVANESHPDLVPPHVHPHSLRHSKAMHLLEAGVNLVYIRDFLGHESVVTTEVYAKANTEAKRKAIEAAEARFVPESGYSEGQKADLMEWLRTLM